MWCATQGECAPAYCEMLVACLYHFCNPLLDMLAGGENLKAPAFRRVFLLGGLGDP